ncbi:hypothetical protein J8F10_13535 [Gemmata sp. G18]|uniref:Uncharacterized protein n=1 Tax=Gemmata palustris TaxID=2822762 RepID=A0ABS5BSB6_9BACT|nr:hypothetical protein [Gemmata palustris]MBP3956307.1 hypothetical protein [Gemmata palustris]
MKDIADKTTMDANEALEKLEHASRRVAKTAAEQIANGADPKEIARQTALTVGDLDGEDKIQHLVAIAQGMTKDEVRQMIATLEAIDEDDEGEDAPKPTPAAKPKKKKPKR